MAEAKIAEAIENTIAPLAKPEPYFRAINQDEFAKRYATRERMA